MKAKTEERQSYGTIQEKLQFEKMWHVSDWGDGEISIGLGVLITYSNGHYEEQKMLFYPSHKSGTLLVSPNYFYKTFQAAEFASDRAKERMKSYYQRQLKEAKEKLGL